MAKKRQAPFPLRVSKDVMGWLKNKAERNDRSLNHVISKLLETEKRREEGDLI